MDCCVRAARDTMPYTSRQCQSSVTAGWTEHVTPYRDASIVWHNVWKDCGSPRNAVIADVMRRSRSQYHTSLRFVKHNQNNDKNESMATVLLENKKEVGKVNKTNTICYPTWLMM